MSVFVITSLIMQYMYEYTYIDQPAKHKPTHILCCIFIEEIDSMLKIVKYN